MNIPFPFSLEFPLVLVVAIPLGLIAAALVWHNQSALKKSLLGAGDLALIGRFAKKTSLSPKVAALTYHLIIGLLVLSAAGLSYPYGQSWVPEGSRDVMIAGDTSISMFAETYKSVMRKFDPKQNKWIDGNNVLGAFGSNLDKMKDITLNELLPALRHNRVGLINYQGNAHGNESALIRLGLSYDTRAIYTTLVGWKHWFDIGTAAASEGSEIATAMNAACIAFDLSKQENRERTLIIFSDGGNDSTDAEMAAANKNCQDHHVEVILVGLGSENDEHIPDYTNDPNGAAAPFMKAWPKYEGPVDTDNNLKTKLDMQELQKIANRCGGKAIEVAPGKSLAINWAFTIAGSHAVQEAWPLYQYTALLAVLLSILISCRGGIRGTVFISFRRRKKAA